MISAIRPPRELVPGRLYACGGAFAADGRVAWLPSGAAGFQATNCYVLKEDDSYLVIDPGPAYQETELLEQIKSLIPPGSRLTVFLTRAEPDSFGCLGVVATTYVVEKLMVGGGPNPFDAFDYIREMDRGRRGEMVQLFRMKPGSGVNVGRNRTLVILHPTIRLLATYWAYDTGTRTLFTSDSFGHVMGDSVEEALSLADETIGAEDDVRNHLLTKFWWLSDANLEPISRNLISIFKEREIDRICPSHGRIISGTSAVQRSFDQIQSVIGRMQATRQSATSAHPTIGQEDPAPGRMIVKMSEADGSSITPKLTATTAVFPREVAPGIWWFGGCLKTDMFGAEIHSHVSPYLIIGAEKTLLVDTGLPVWWRDTAETLDRLLGDRPLDWVIPTHPEIPHAGNLGRLLDKYKNLKVGGDVRDYHLYYPELGDRFHEIERGADIDLGGGYRFTILTAIIKDLPNTVWGYESKQQVLFTADAFAFMHHPAIETPDSDSTESYHLPGECALMANELPAPPSLEHTYIITNTALFWSRYVRIAPYLTRVAELIRKYPIKLLAPAHGHVIPDLDDVMPVMTEAYQRSYESGLKTPVAQG